jgi:hypothetical protein
MVVPLVPFIDDLIGPVNGPVATIVGNWGKNASPIWGISVWKLL